MGMFDREKSLTKQDDFDITQPFEMVSAEYLGQVKSADYGDNQKARVTVNVGGENVAYSVYGVMADQIQRMEADDLPATVQVVKDGRANVFERVEAA